MTILEEKIESLLRPLLHDEGVELVTIRFYNENEDNFLELGVKMIEGTTDLNAIETVSRFISDWLDRVDLIEDAYLLDVYAVSEPAHA